MVKESALLLEEFTEEEVGFSIDVKGYRPPAGHYFAVKYVFQIVQA